MKYDPQAIERKWQSFWESSQAFQAQVSSKPKYYVLEMLPYPSGHIHMGHVRNYMLGDIIARYKTRKGFNVIHPMGWDAFGLPAENAAIERATHPKTWTYQNIANMKEELKKLGFSYDWDKELATCNPGYYKHQQKIFLDFLKAGLAYQAESSVNWDPVDQTVLANEQVVDGKGWRSGAVVEKRKLKQWFLKITDFAEELLSGLKGLDWAEHVKLMQEKWINKSEGWHIKFQVEGSDKDITVFTTRPDTLFGCTFVALSSEHPFASRLAEQDSRVREFVAKCKLGSTQEAEIEKAEKLGIDTGLRVIHPITKKPWPLFIVNYVLMDYGTGAIYGCPGVDDRDNQFAASYGIDVIPQIEEGRMINAEWVTGKTTEEAKELIGQHLESEQLGSPIVCYRLKDWGVSRQRYWGCPIPVIHCKDCGVVPARDLPVQLPDEIDLGGSGQALKNHPTWKHVKCPECGQDAERETDTLDTFFDSSWYFLRYTNPHIDAVIDSKAVDYWLSVDQYIGGIEHAVMHLLYARFFMKAMQVCGYSVPSEPFQSLLSQGMITHMSYQTQNHKWVDVSDVVIKGGKPYSIATGEELVQCRVEKMSKSKKNTVAPGEILKRYGADTARLFVVSDSPPQKELEWTDAGIEGCNKFLNRVFTFVMELKPTRGHGGKTTDKQLQLQRKVHSAIKSATDYLEQLHFNKMIAIIRELSNEIFAFQASDDSDAAVVFEATSVMVQLLNPIVPHITEELWKIMGHKTPLTQTDWPALNEALLKQSSATIAIQVNGKLRGTLVVALDIPQDEIERLALEKVASFVSDRAMLKKVIHVPGKVVNLVV
jgi:leucyl-tRNA synthetase